MSQSFQGHCTPRGGAHPACPVMSGELLSFHSWSLLGSDIVKPKTLGCFQFGVFGFFIEASVGVFSFAHSALLGKQLSLWSIV